MVCAHAPKEQQPKRADSRKEFWNDVDFFSVAYCGPRCVLLLLLLLLYVWNRTAPSGLSLFLARSLSHSAFIYILLPLLCSHSRSRSLKPWRVRRRRRPSDDISQQQTDCFFFNLFLFFSFFLDFPLDNGRFIYIVGLTLCTSLYKPSLSFLHIYVYSTYIRIYICVCIYTFLYLDRME